MTNDELNQRLGEIVALRRMLDFLRAERESLESALGSGAISEECANGFSCSMVRVIEESVYCLLRIEAEIQQAQSERTGRFDS